MKLCNVHCMVEVSHSKKPSSIPHVVVLAWDKTQD